MSSAHSGFAEIITHRSKCKPSSISEEFYRTTALAIGEAVWLGVRRSSGRICSRTFYCENPEPDCACFISLEFIHACSTESPPCCATKEGPGIQRTLSPKVTRPCLTQNHATGEHQADTNIPPHAYLSWSRLLAKGGSHLYSKGFVSFPSSP